MIKKREFGKLNDGSVVYEYTITNKNGVSLSVLNYGGIITKLEVPTSDGVRDIVLGYDNLEDYFSNLNFFGCFVGPYANRIANASFMIDGKTYSVCPNDGVNNLHSDMDLGYHKRLFDVVEEDNKVIMSLSDNETMGFPGKKDVSISYSLNDLNEVVLEYSGKTDKKTPFNFTNHSYFNPNGHNSDSIKNCLLQLDCDKVCSIRSGAIPTGIVSVYNTDFDFNNAKLIGDVLDKTNDNEQLQLVGGIDHSFGVKDYDGNLRRVGSITSSDSLVTIECLSDLEAVQVYTGNMITDCVGKEDAYYTKNSGVCLETQFHPDSVNHPEWEDCIYDENRDYNSTTKYKILVK